MSKEPGPVQIMLEVLRQPMLALLIAGGVVYLLIGSLEEALVLLAFACLSVGITVVQEARTERVLEALRDLTSPRALVIRRGERLRIAGREVALSRPYDHFTLTLFVNLWADTVRFHARCP